MNAEAPKSVLVVEDNEDLRNLCVLILEAEGYRAIGVEDGEDALRLLRADPTMACVIILDLRLPRLDGPSLLKLKSADPHVAEIPVIVVSATTEAVFDSRTPDVKAVLSKPTAIPELLREVNRWALLSDCSGAR